MFKAAFYEKEITPPLGSFMPGSGKRIFSEDVRDKLYAKALVVQNENKTIAMLVMDAIKFPVDWHTDIFKRIYDYTGIEAENIMLSANHTHRGGPVEGSLSMGCMKDAEYISMLKKLLADCVILAYKRLDDVSIKYASGQESTLAFNRDFVMRDGVISCNSGRDNTPASDELFEHDFPVADFEKFHPTLGRKIINPNCIGNLAGIDPELPILLFEDENGNKKGAIINYAMHQAICGGLAVTGDYSSILSKELKKVYGDDFVSFFIIGAAGDINHVDPSIPVTEDDYYIKVGKTLAKKAVELIDTAEPICDYELNSLKEELPLKTRKADTELLVSKAKQFADNPTWVNLMLLRCIVYYDACDTPENCSAFVQVIKIGDVYIYALPGEMYVNFGLYIKENSPSSKNFITELSNGGCNGYIPTREAFVPQSKLYEISLKASSYLEPEAGYKISDKAVELAKRV